MKEKMVEHDEQAPGWTRHELNLRLTKRRLAQLRAIAGRLPGAPTPTDALDYAIARALEEAEATASGLEAVEQGLAELAERTDARLGALEHAAREAARSSAALYSLISEALAVGDEG